MPEIPGDWAHAVRTGMDAELSNDTNKPMPRSGPIGVAPQSPRAKKETSMRDRFQQSQVRVGQYRIDEPAELTELEYISTTALRSEGWFVVERRISFDQQGKALVLLMWIQPDPDAKPDIPEDWLEPEVHLDENNAPYMIQPPYPKGVPPNVVAPGNAGVLHPRDFGGGFAEAMSMPLDPPAAPEESSASDALIREAQERAELEEMFAPKIELDVEEELDAFGLPAKKEPPTEE